eukprot:173839_1
MPLLFIAICIFRLFVMSTSHCGTFPKAVLQPVTSSDAKYKDINSMGMCLFDSVPNYQLSDNFALSEFKCKDGSRYLRLSPKLIQCLQIARDALGTPLTINSGYRTVSHNTAVGGVTTSRHMSGTAADVNKPSSVTMMTFADTLICSCRSLFQANGYDIGLGLYGTFIHVDMRPSFGSWIGTGAIKTKTQWMNYIHSKVCHTFW